MVPPGEEHRWDDKKKFRLGATEAEAYRTWAKRVERYSGKLDTIGQGLDRFLIEVVPTLAPATQESYRAAIGNLKDVFGDMLNTDFKPVHAYRYRDNRKKKIPNPADPAGEPLLVPAPTAANRELEVLSAYFTKAIEWGLREDHPMTESKFRKLRNPARDREVEDWEMEELQKVTPRRHYGSVRMCQAYARVKYLVGRRRVEILGLKTEQLRDDGILFALAKRRQTKIKFKLVEWSDALHAAINDALAARPVDIGPYVFCKADGSPYLKEDGQVADAWDSVWQRFMDRVLAETKITERFTDHDIRAKSATDVATEEHAQQLMAHADPATTRRIYRRARIEKTRPVK